MWDLMWDFISEFQMALTTLKVKHAGPGSHARINVEAARQWRLSAHFSPFPAFGLQLGVARPHDDALPACGAVSGGVVRDVGCARSLAPARIVKPSMRECQRGVAFRGKGRMVRAAVLDHAVFQAGVARGQANIAGAFECFQEGAVLEHLLAGEATWHDALVCFDILHFKPGRTEPARVPATSS
ncbi:hypothetical protein HMP06_1312 [Sphingomonas sp. HMP6]|nr:hypothetical protein HMP06_1312 [Sphingomonas sp. HMP6]